MPRRDKIGFSLLALGILLALTVCYILIGSLTLLVALSAVCILKGVYLLAD